MKRDVNFNSLTEVQIAYIKSLEEKIKSQNNLLDAKELEIKNKDLEIQKQKEEIEIKNKTIEELTKIINSNKELVKRLNVERFVSKKDVPSTRSSGLKTTAKTEKKTPGRKKGSKNFANINLDELSKENETITLDIANELLASNPDLKLKKIDEESTYLIKRIKASIKVYKVVNKVYKGSDNKIYRAENNLSPINHSMIHSSLLSDAIVMKYLLGVPEYRYSKWLNSCGFSISQKTLNNWALNSADLLSDFYENMKTLYVKDDLNIKNINIDETWLNVIDNNKIDRKKSYIFCYSATGKYGKIPFFEYSLTRKTESVEKILKNYNGVITVDGYGGYDNVLDGKILKQRCMVHARREFANNIKTLKKEEAIKTESYKVITKIDELFKKESEFKKRKLSPLEKVKERNSEEYLKIKDDLEKTIQNIKPESGSQLEKAIKYWNNLKDEKWTYLNHGEVDLDNNEAERQAKKFVIDRKNFLFSKNNKGAKASCILLTIIDFAYSNKIDPRNYLEYLLDHHEEDFENLLPWSENIKNLKDMKI